MEGVGEKDVTDQEYIRISSLDRIGPCPASYAESKGKPSVGSPASLNGTAGHKIFEMMAKEESIDFPTVCAQFGVDDWQKLKKQIDSTEFIPPKGCLTEEEVVIDFGLKGIPNLKGHIDLLCLDKAEPYVLDYKWSELRGNTPKVDERIQVPTYAWGAAMRYDLSRIDARILNPVIGKYGWSSRTYNTLEIKDGVEMVRDIAIKAKAQESLPLDERDYNAGDHCTFCPGRVTCPAINQELEAVAVLDGTGLPASRDRLPALVQFSKQLISRAEKIVKLAREEIQVLGDIHHNGLSLVGTTRMKRPSMSAKAIMSWLEENGHGEIVNACEAALLDRPKRTEFVMSVKKTKEEVK